MKNANGELSRESQRVHAFLASKSGWQTADQIASALVMKREVVDRALFHLMSAELVTYNHGFPRNYKAR